MNYTVKTNTYFEMLLALSNKLYKVISSRDDICKEDLLEALRIGKELKEENDVLHAAILARENRRYGDSTATATRLINKATSMLESIKPEDDYEAMDKDELVALLRKMKEENSNNNTNENANTESENRELVLGIPGKEEGGEQ